MQKTLPLLWTSLNIRDKIANTHLQSSGDSQENVHRGNLETALDLSNVHRVQVNLLRQFLLGETGELAIFPNTAA